MSNHTAKLGTEKVGKLLFNLSLPAITGMIVMALYNFVDTLFIARGVGEVALAGVTFVLPLQMFSMAVALMVGIGASSIISRRLGENKKHLAELTLGNATILAIGFGFSLMFLCFLLDGWLFEMLGVSPESLPYAWDYFRIIIIGFPIISFTAGVNNIIRAEGAAKIAMGTMLVSAILNVILDPIAIFILDMGTFGAGLATVISQTFAGIFILYYFLRKKSTLNYHLKNLKLKFSVVKEILTIGAPSFVRQLSFSVMAIILNKSLMFYSGTMAVATMGIIQRIHMMVLMPLFGIVQGMMPIAGYNYGAKKLSRVRDVLHLGLKVTIIMSITAYVILFFFLKEIISIFSSNSEIIAFGTKLNWYILFGLVFVGYQLCAGSLFQALGLAKKSLLAVSLRQALLLIPLLVILPLFFGVEGILYAFPIADLVSFIIIWFMMRPIKKMIAD